MQNKLINKVALLLERDGATDEWFKDNCLEMDFFRELLKRVVERENKSCDKKKFKNKQVNKPIDNETRLLA